MAEINSHLFQAAATIYQALLENPNNRVPHDPQYAHQARSIAEALYSACSKNPVLTAAAARIVAGFYVNSQSAHCSEQELVNLGVMGARYLIESFGNAPAVRMPVMPAQHSFSPTNPIPFPQMPPQQSFQMPPQQTFLPAMPVAVPPGPQAPSQPVFAAPPPVPLDVPDFTTGGGQA